MDNPLIIKLTVDIYFNNLEDIERGYCEVITNTQRNPYGNWRHCISQTVDVEVEV